MAVSENDLVVGPVTPANGVSVISIDFFFEADELIEVFKTGNPLPLVQGVNYTLTGAGTNTGTVVLTVPANGTDQYAVFLMPILARSSDLQLRGEFKSDPFNDELDRVWQALQALNTKINRGMLVSETSVPVAPMIAETAASRIGRVPVFNATGLGLALGPDVSDIVGLEGVAQDAIDAAAAADASAVAAAAAAAAAATFDPALYQLKDTVAVITAGTNAQGQGLLTAVQNVVTVTAANPSGVTLPTPVAGQTIVVANRGTNPINIYPALGASIGNLGVNLPYSLPVNQVTEFYARTATQWEGQISQVIDSDLGALAAVSTTGLLARTGAGTAAARTITSTDSSVTITNPGGVAGNIDLSVALSPTNFGNVSLSGAGPFNQLSIPANAKRVRAYLEGASVTGANNILIRLGTSGGFDSTANYVYNADGGISATGTSFQVRTVAGANTLTGMLEFTKHPTTDRWTLMSTIIRANDGGSNPTYGTKLLTGVLDRIQILPSGGDTFDAGNLVYEWSPV